MYLSRRASRARLREAQNARDNRAEIVKALSQGQITRRDLFKWGLFTASGALALKHGLSPYAPSAYGAVPTGTPPSPLFGATPFSQPMPRLNLQTPVPMDMVGSGPDAEAAFRGLDEPNAKRLSWHTDFSNSGGRRYRNPKSLRGPMEGRPPGEWFAHQRWQELFPKVGYVMSLGQIAPGTKLHPFMPSQNPDSIWTFNAGRFTNGVLAPPLIKARYGEPILARIYNNLPLNRAQNGGFGRNEPSIHLHNAHIAAESDGANNAYFFPGQFYDYNWSLMLARADEPQYQNGDPRASGPDDNGGVIPVPGDFREKQGTLWFHDHRFFFTAENVYKGFAGMMNVYSGPDRGNEEVADGINLRLPSGRLLPWGNLDFDVNLLIADYALNPAGQLFFDIFDTDGFIGDQLHVNYAHKPYFEVLPRKYRFRILNACMSRFLKLVLVAENGTRVPFQFIANDGNLVVNPITLNELDYQATGERYDIVVDFSAFAPGSRVRLVNVAWHNDGRGPEGAVAPSFTLSGVLGDPAASAVLEFRITGEVASVDVPGVTHRATDLDRSVVPAVLTEQIPIVAPVRTRVIEWNRVAEGQLGDSRGPNGCTPDCGEREVFPWAVSVNGQAFHTLNANRISLLIPRPGEVEHWTYVNGGGGWDHPIHLHFEEGVTINRGGGPIGPTELLVRKDVWRLRPGGSVTFQVKFGEFGGAYVNHCHNTIHEDAAMLLRYDVLTDRSGDLHAAVIPTPIPTPDGCQFMTPDILPEARPQNNSTPTTTVGGTPLERSTRRLRSRNRRITRRRRVARG